VPTVPQHAYTRECGLTPRSSGAPPAGHQARALLWFILHRAGLASCRRRPLTSNVRQHSPTMRHNAAVVERQAARSPGASRRSPPFVNTGASIAPLKSQRRQEQSLRSSVLLSNSTPSASRPRLGRLDVALGSQSVVPAVGSTTVPSAACGAGGGRGRQRGTSEEQGVWRRKCGSLRSLSKRGPRRVLPNPSVKRTRNGVAPGPRGRVVYPRPHGPGATPLRAAYLER
jgi:hypothetical protein